MAINRDIVNNPNNCYELDVSGDTRLKGSLNLGSNANEFTVDTSGNTYIDGTLDVSGDATAPTAPSGTITTQIATTAFVDDAVSNIQLSTISAGTNGTEFTVDSIGNTKIAGTLMLLVMFLLVALLLLLVQLLFPI